MANQTGRFLGWMAAAWAAVFFVGASFRVLADCAAFGLPFTDLGADTNFCAAIAEAYYTGLTHGTSSTTFSPSANVTREQAAAFITRTLDAALVRGSRRAALDQWWTSTPHYDQSLGTVSVGNGPQLLKSDGTDIWVANFDDGTVSRVQASSGKVLGTWTGADGATGVLIAMGKVFVTGFQAPGKLYEINPAAAPGTVTTVVSTLPIGSTGIAFDGNNIWTANGNGGNGGSVSIITPGTWTFTTVTAGFINSVPKGLVFDGKNMWVTDSELAAIDKLDSNGAIVSSVFVDGSPLYPAFDGANIWVPNGNGQLPSLTVLRSSDGTVLKHFSAANGNKNGLTSPYAASFDGQRILVTNVDGNLSLFQASSLSPLGAIAPPGVTEPLGVCSDGVNFWVAFGGSAKIGRF